MKKNLLLPALLCGAALAAGAQNVETRAYYSTNADNAVGQPATITINGSLTGWTEDMCIATCGANDMATAFKGSHENCVLDMYALYAAWDDNNIYLAWQMCNTGDTWAREGDGPLTDYGHIGNVPLIVAISVDPSKPGMTGKLTDGRCVWCDQAGMGTTFDPEKVHVDHLFFFSGQAGQGKPAMFTAVNTKGDTDYGQGCHEFSSIGVKYNLTHDFLPSHLWRQNTHADYDISGKLISDPSIIENIYDPECYDNLLAGPVSGLKKHSHEYDTFYEMQIPMKALGIDRRWLEENGIGVRVIGTRGESAIDCIPFDPSMVDNTFESYGKDKSTTHEKDDIDVITYAMADVAKIRDLENIEPVDPDDPIIDPVDPDDPIIPVDGAYNVYFDNSDSNWGSVNVYIWDKANQNFQIAGTWPGKPMTQGSFNGRSLHHFSFNYDATNPDLMVIFNGNGTQTADLKFVNNGVYSFSGHTGETIDTDGINDITADTDNIPAVYYNLQGIQVHQPAAGMYIEKRGTTVRKVIIR